MAGTSYRYALVQANPVLIEVPELVLIYDWPVSTRLLGPGGGDHVQSGGCSYANRVVTVLAMVAGPAKIVCHAARA